MSKRFSYLFGPVASWRLGTSLGIDPLSSTDKVCNFDCVYCQLGPTRQLTLERKIFVPTAAILDELKAFPKNDIDFYTFSASGETTLAANLGELIDGVRGMGLKKIAVITNGSLMDREDVRRDLMGADLVMTKCEAFDAKSFSDVNGPAAEVTFDRVRAGLKAFRKVFKGRLAVQVMLIKENINNAKEIAQIISEIAPDEVHLNTPLRPCAVAPLSKEQMQQVKGYFSGMDVSTVYERNTSEVDAVDAAKTEQRHGKYRNVRNLD